MCLEHAFCRVDVEGSLLALLLHKTESFMRLSDGYCIQNKMGFYFYDECGRVRGSSKVGFYLCILNTWRICGTQMNILKANRPIITVRMMSVHLSLFVRRKMTFACLICTEPFAWIVSTNELQTEHAFTLWRVPQSLHRCHQFNANQFTHSIKCGDQPDASAQYCKRIEWPIFIQN